MKYLIAFTTLLFVISTAAGDLHGVSVPDTLTVEGKSLKLNGMGLRKVYGLIQVYIGALYLEASSGDTNAILASDGIKHLEMHFKRSLAGKKLRTGWKEAFKKNKVEGYSYTKDLNKLNGMMKNINKNQVIKMTFFKDKTLIDVKGSVQEIDGADFGKQLLKVFIGDPPNPELKQGLLGLKSK